MNCLNNIKKNTIIFLLFLVVSSCSINPKVKNIDIFKNIEWYAGDKLIFRNDSSVCFTKYDTVNNIPTYSKSFSLNLNDTTLIYTRFKEMWRFDDNREHTVTHIWSTHSNIS